MAASPVVQSTMLRFLPGLPLFANSGYFSWQMRYTDCRGHIDDIDPLVARDAGWRNG